MAAGALVCGSDGAAACVVVVVVAVVVAVVVVAATVAVAAVVAVVAVVVVDGKNDWKRHENNQHFQLEIWRCAEKASGAAAPDQTRRPWSG
ncbi:f72d3149-c9f4-4cd5-aaff-37bdd8237933 [Thermothielavioides terrestris]|uniref:F72d3149-c9f4-4cd5-aaff-37bdd8237933 n=1 Tax=Thermothielavioides terrestris TaxID=2587410 RepID=A0A446BHZ3_9PEZI|nr:f72d3149-c9f4-4cd5-aaff-37bdd8237933 [Thermothielavioides terrestris]